MKTKELKNLAKKIAKLEMQLQEAQDEKVKREIQNEIVSLSSHVDSLEDIVKIDDFVFEILQKEKKES